MNTEKKEKWSEKSPEWKKGWYAGQFGEDINMSKEEIENMPNDWKDGLKYALLNPIGGFYVPM